MGQINLSQFTVSPFREIRHKGVRHPGLHEPIVDRELWEKTQRLLRSHAVRGASRATKSVPSPLMGRLFDERGVGLTPSHAVKGERRYRYYVSRSLICGGAFDGRRSALARRRRSSGRCASACHLSVPMRRLLRVRFYCRPFPHSAFPG